MKMHKVFWRLMGLLLLLLASSPCFAVRPFTTEDAGVAGKGQLQLEYSIDSIEDKNGTERLAQLLVLIYGPTERIETSVEIPYLVPDPEGEQKEHGVGDLNLVFKGLILPETQKRPAMLFKALLKLETGDEDKGIGSGDGDLSLVAVFSKAVGPCIFHLNLGHTFVGDDHDETFEDHFDHGFAMEYCISEKLRLNTEVAGTYNHQDGHRTVGLWGFSYNLTHELIVDVSFRLGLSHEGLDRGVGVGFALNF